MSVFITFSCDGHRGGGQPCRKALHTRTTYLTDAYREANSAGWHYQYATGRHICPSKGHDEDKS